MDYTLILPLYTPIVRIAKTPTDKQYKAKRKQILNYLVIIVDNLNYITMNTNTVLNKVRELLGMQIELEQRKLEDGVTIVEADSFEAEAEIFIVTEDEQKIALPVGEYKNGRWNVAYRKRGRNHCRGQSRGRSRRGEKRGRGSERRGSRIRGERGRNGRR